MELCLSLRQGETLLDLNAVLYIMNSFKSVIGLTIDGYRHNI